MKNRVIRIILHITTWLLVLGLPLISSRRLVMNRDFLLFFYIFTAISCLIFYSNYLLLVPKYFFQKKKFKYYLSVLFLLVCFYFISDMAGKQIIRHMAVERRAQLERAPGERRLPAPQSPPGPLRRFLEGAPQVMGYLSSASLMVFLSLGLRVLERQSRIEKMQEEAEKARLNAELALLKNQISPHFFFNTLNNIYSLIGINAEDSKTAVLKLSKLMRYLLYESDNGDSKLSNEIEFMKNYIDLMKLRMNEKVSLSVEFPENFEDISIPPLLFISFIENAFKHGITNRGKSFISISLQPSKSSIDFRCTNSIAENSQKDKQPGIGLENVRKRLNLLFPGKHDLVITNENNEFAVLLKLFLT